MSTTVRVLLLLFQFGFLLFLFLLWLLWPKLPKLCCIIVVIVGTLVFSPLRIMFAAGLSYIAFIMLRNVPSIHAFWRVFLINGCWVLSKAFSASIEIIIWLLFFNLIMWCITLIDLWILMNPCIPGIKSTWSWCMIFLMCCWILIARILLRILHLCSSVILACSFLFVWHLFQVLILGWWWPHRMSLKVYLPLQFSGRVWVG